VATQQTSRPSTRYGLALRLAAVVAVLVVGGAGVWFLTRATAPGPELTTSDIPALQVKAANVRPGSAVPVSLTAASPNVGNQNTAGQNTGPGTTTAPTSLTDWANRVSVATGIPEPALWAYGNAELAIRATGPGCHLTWATLAGIGRVESDHGRFGGAYLTASGEESRPIIGVPLDGTGGVRDIPDTDHGRYDGDPVHDHAVGPMQFLPSTWSVYGADALGNGNPDPENVDDAALAAARYLCSGGRDMGTPAGWWSGLLSYNDSTQYGQKVFGLADTYARQAVAALGAPAR
jgi:membrane-bound lytic murein transglycosylase B